MVYKEASDALALRRTGQRRPLSLLHCTKGLHSLHLICAEHLCAGTKLGALPSEPQARQEAPSHVLCPGARSQHAWQLRVQVAVRWLGFWRFEAATPPEEQQKVAPPSATSFCGSLLRQW